VDFHHGFRKFGNVIWSAAACCRFRSAPQYQRPYKARASSRTPKKLALAQSSLKG